MIEILNAVSSVKSGPEKTVSLLYFQLSNVARYGATFTPPSSFTID